MVRKYGWQDNFNNECQGTSWNSYDHEESWRAIQNKYDYRKNHIGQKEEKISHIINNGSYDRNNNYSNYSDCSNYYGGLYNNRLYCVNPYYNYANEDDGKKYNIQGEYLNKKKYYDGYGRDPWSNAQERHFNIQGKSYNMSRDNYYTDYITRYNNIYVTDYKNKNGKFCCRKILIVPRKQCYLQRQYEGSKWR